MSHVNPRARELVDERRGAVSVDGATAMTDDAIVLALAHPQPRIDLRRSRRAGAP